jgi:putative Holliday junction resolvase
MAKLVGIDYGEKNIGIALSDESQKLAFPKKVLKNDKKLLANLKKICEEGNVESVVIGESRDLKGQANPILENIYSFKNRIERELRLKVYLVPEFFTSKQASRIQGRNEEIHASAAAIILQSFLDSK